MNTPGAWLSAVYVRPSGVTPPGPTVQTTLFDSSNFAFHPQFTLPGSGHSLQFSVYTSRTRAESNDPDGAAPIPSPRAAPVAT